VRLHINGWSNSDPIVDGTICLRNINLARTREETMNNKVEFGWIREKNSNEQLAYKKHTRYIM